MKALINTKVLILHLFAVSLLCTNVACSNDHNDPNYDVEEEFMTPKFVDDDYYVTGIAAVQFTRNAVENFMLDIKNERVSTSIDELDKFLAGLHILGMERLFMPSLNSEQMEKEAELDLWYKLYFNEVTPVKLIIHHLEKLDMIQIVEPILLNGDASNFKGESENILIEIQNSYIGLYPLMLFCKTETQFKSGGYQLITDQSLKKNSLTINFTGVSAPDPESFVTGAFSPATAIVDLTDFENGKYEIELNNGSLKNTGTLTITNEKVELLVKNQKGIKIVNPTLEKATTSN